MKFGGKSENLFVLKVNILEGRNLVAKDRNGFSDPYVVVKVGKKKMKTKMIKKTLNPEWNQQVHVPLKTSEKSIVLECWDRDSFKFDDPMGRVEFLLNDILHAREQFAKSQWYPLRELKSSGSNCGEIRVSFTVLEQEKNHQQHKKEITNVNKKTEKNNGENSYPNAQNDENENSQNIKKNPKRHHKRNNTLVDATSNSWSNLPAVVFNKYDLDKNGTIDRDEFYEMALELGYYFDDVALQEAFHILDQDGSGQIEMREFVEFWERDNRFEFLQLDYDQRQKMKQISEYFSFFDSNSVGKLDKAQFQDMYDHMIASGYSLNSFVTVWQELDINQDGFVHFNELLAFTIKRGLLI